MLRPQDASRGPGEERHRKPRGRPRLYEPPRGTPRHIRLPHFLARQLEALTMRQPATPRQEPVHEEKGGAVQQRIADRLVQLVNIDFRNGNVCRHPQTNFGH